MLVDTPLPEAQKRQMGQMLARMIAGGAGELEVVVERSRVRWLRPAIAIYNPDEARFHPVGISKHVSLEDLMGDAWWTTFVTRLVELLAHGWGKMVIQVDHHEVQSICYVHDVRAADSRKAFVQ